jgi:hypothetical protein
MRVVESAPDKPENFLVLAETLLTHGSVDNANALWECISRFRDWNIPFDQGLVRFMQDSEWNWRNGRAPLQDW